jgi:hypothetical protein
LPGGAGLRVGVDVLLQQPGDQVPAQVDGPFLALVEGDELVLVFGVEHQVEGGAAVAEETLAEFLTAGSGIGGRIIHDGYSSGTPQRTATTGLSYPKGTRAGTRLHPRDYSQLTTDPRAHSNQSGRAIRRRGGDSHGVVGGKGG